MPSGSRCGIVAELGANHGKSLQKMRQMIHAASACGADAVKIQLYEPQDLTLKRYTPDFRIAEGLWKGWSLWDLYERAAMPRQWTPELLDLAKSLNLGFIASVFSPRTVDWAVEYGVGVLKVSSFEISHKILHNHLISMRVPVIISTGMASLTELCDIVEMYQGKEIMLLKCVSQYPAPLDAMNLRTIPDMRDRFGVPVGLSDHSLGCVAPVAAVSLGASLIEKHFKIDEDGFDVAFSLTPRQFATMVETVRATETALGTVDYAPAASKFKRREVEGQWVRTAN